MIDTDKYTGHTEGPWTLSEEYAYELFVYAGDVRLAKMDYSSRRRFNEYGNPEDVNAQLIADAPLILADYKRLQKIIGKFDEFMCGNWTRENLHRTFTGTKGLWNELLTKEEE